MKRLAELMTAVEEKDLNLSLKRAFFADEPVVIDHHESEALIILVNLTRPASKRTSLLDKCAAKELFQSEQWHTDLLATAPWVTTHYIKDPNSRATGCIRKIPDQYGVDGQKHLGWSHNSNKVPISHLLTTEFIWHGRVTSLYEQFSLIDESFLTNELINLGFPEHKTTALRKACCNGMVDSLPDYVSPNSKVLLFPDKQGQYIAITPVVSANMQRWIHTLVKNPSITCRPVFYPRPFQISSFLGTCGGTLYCLYYPPRLGRSDYTLNSLLEQWKYKKHLLNERAIYHKENLNFLLQIVTESQTVESERQQKKRLQHRFERMEQYIEDLFSHLLLLRSQYSLSRKQLSEVLENCAELDFIQGNVGDEETLLNHFLLQLNDILQQSQYSAQLSYHPLLLPLVSKALMRFIQKSVQPSKHDKSLGSFLHFHRLLAYDANARNNPYILGLPALTAWAGFVHAFLCNLGYSSNQVDFRFVVILRKFAMNKGHPLPGQEIKNGKLSYSPVIDRRSCDIEFDLIIQLPVSEKACDLNQQNLFGSLPMRFAGGTLTHPMEGTYGQCRFFRQCDIYETCEDLSESIRQLPSFARILTSVDSISDKQKLIEGLSEDKGFPIGSGFHFLGNPLKRQGVGDYLHAFAEPSFSLAKLHSVHAINPLKNSFWSLKTTESSIEVSV